MIDDAVKFADESPEPALDTLTRESTSRSSHSLRLSLAISHAKEWERGQKARA